MPNWDSVLKEINLSQISYNQSAFDRVRRKYLKQLSKHTKRNVIAYYSGFLSKPATNEIIINDEDKNGFMLCIHGMNKSAGLDLILHTPGGDGKATESLVDYLRSIFQKDIRAIVPQISMSAGTMIACSCRSIVMGKHSSLGPIDPQFGTISAVGLLAEVKRAYDEIKADPKMASFWSPILSRLTPSFLQRCEEAVKDSNKFITTTLQANMFSALKTSDRKKRLTTVSEMLANTKDGGKAHNTHFQSPELQAAGLVIESLEEDQKLQDLVLTIHHCYMHSLSNTPAIKIIENHLGRAMVKVAAPMMMQAGPINIGAPLQPSGIFGT